MNTQTDTSLIRNFSIVAHIDHGKSTISDRILELTHTVEQRDLYKQMLDSMDIEQERGITIKSNAVRVMYDADDGNTYQLNLIDTPGHVDFTYEVSRSLAACEGAVLVVDATQGVEAQTVSNALLAMNADLEIVPAINKIDLPSAEPERVREEIEEVLAIPADDAVCVSGKTGEGIHDLLESICYLIPPPEGDATAPLKALILDSYFDAYRGVVAMVRIFDGSVRAGDRLIMMAEDQPFLAEEVGVKRPLEQPLDQLGMGEVGYLVTGLKDPALVKTGDTVTGESRRCAEPCPGYHEAKPMVFTGIFPIDNKYYENLRDALEKLKVNDPSLTWTPETSVALGFGFRVGFLGLLHMEVVKERLEREFDLDLIATSPSVDYHVYLTDGQMMEMALVENIQRENLNAMDVALSYNALIEECSLTHEQLSERVGKSRSTITNYLRLLGLPAETQLALSQDKISMAHARVLAGVEDVDRHTAILHAILERGLSVHDTELMAKAPEKSGTKSKRGRKPSLPKAYTEACAGLKSYLQSEVEVKRSNRGRGTLTIHFNTDADFERLVGLLKK